jgi:hypothetical protein
MVSSICNQVEVDITRFVQEQLRHEPLTDRALHYNSSHGALLHGPRITQLQIPQTETTYFGPDGSSTAVPGNFLVSVRHPSFKTLNINNTIDIVD